MRRRRLGPGYRSRRDRAGANCLLRALGAEILTGSPPRLRRRSAGRRGRADGGRGYLRPCPAAARIYEGDFVAALITGGTARTAGCRADVFPVPAVGQSGPVVIAGGDAAGLMRRSRARGAHQLVGAETPCTAADLVSPAGLGKVTFDIWLCEIQHSGTVSTRATTIHLSGGAPRVRAAGRIAGPAAGPGRAAALREPAWPTRARSPMAGRGCWISCGSGWASARPWRPGSRRPAASLGRAGAVRPTSDRAGTASRPRQVPAP